MSTIETEMIDRYVMSMMTDRSIPVAERAHSAAAAIAVHVMTEVRLPMNIPLVVEQEEIDFLLSAHQDRFADHCDDLADAVDEAYEALGLHIVPELQRLAREVAAMDEADMDRQAFSVMNADMLAEKMKPDSSIKPSTMRLVDENFHSSMLDQTIIDYAHENREDMR